MLDKDWSLNILSTHKEDIILWLGKVCIFCSSLNGQNVKGKSQLFLSVVYHIKHKRSCELPLRNKTKHQNLQTLLLCIHSTPVQCLLPPGLVHHDP